MERLVLNSGRPLPLLPNWSLDDRVDNVEIARDGVRPPPERGGRFSSHPVGMQGNHR